MTTATTSMAASTSGGTAVRTRRPVSQVSIAAGAASLAVIEAFDLAGDGDHGGQDVDRSQPVNDRQPEDPVVRDYCGDHRRATSVTRRISLESRKQHGKTGPHPPCRPGPDCRRPVRLARGPPRRHATPENLPSLSSSMSALSRSHPDNVCHYRNLGGLCRHAQIGRWPAFPDLGATMADHARRRCRAARRGIGPTVTVLLWNCEEYYGFRARRRVPQRPGRRSAARHLAERAGRRVSRTAVRGEGRVREAGGATA